jgi:hypothetical protein
VKRFSGILLMLFGLPFLACGLYLLLSLAGALRMTWEIEREWARVPATILAHEDIVLGVRRPIRVPTVRYAYDFEGRRFESNRHDLLQTFPVASRYLRRGRLTYDVGQAVTARVDPKSPEDAVLSTETRYASLLGPGGLLFALFGSALVLGPLQARLRMDRDRFLGLVRPCVETSQGGLAVLVGAAVLITITTALVLTEAGAWSLPGAILVIAFAAGAAALARLWLREEARRRPFAASRLRLSAAEWALSRGRLTSPSFELALREETRSMGDDGPGPWTGTDLACAALEASPCPEGWRGTLRIDASQPAPVDELLRRRYWVVRVREGALAAQFPIAPGGRT